MASFKNLISKTSAQISSGGTITGSLVINGDLQVDGGGSLSFDEIIEGTQVIDVTSTEALLVRKNGDGGDVFIVDSTNTRIGVGVTPSYLFHAESQVDGNYVAYFKNTDADNGYGVAIDAGEDANVNALQVRTVGGSNLFVVNGAGTATFSEISISGSTISDSSALTISSGDDITIDATSDINLDADGGDIRFKDNGTNFVTFSSSTGSYFAGNVGIGTDSPMNKVQINHSGADGDNALMLVNKNTTVAADACLGIIGFDSADGNVPSSGYEASGYIAVIASENHSATEKGGHILFGTTADNDDDDTGSHERMRLTSAGNLGIGCIPDAKLVVAQSGVDTALKVSREDQANIQLIASGRGSVRSSSSLALQTGGANIRMLLDDNSRISLSNNDSGTDNTVFGFMAGAALASGGVENTLVGDYAGTAITTGDYNTAVGKNALPSDDVGQSSTAIGYSALGSQNTGTQSHVNNVGVGVNTGYYNGTGTNNTWLGSNAGTGASGNSNSNNVITNHNNTTNTDSNNNTL